MNQERRVGLVLLIGCILVVGVFAAIFIAREASSLYYTIVFNDAEGLQVGDPVQVNGVDIGVVKSVELQTQPEPRIDVRVKVYPKHIEKVLADSTAIISAVSFPNVSGQKIVEIHNSGSDPPAKPMQEDAEINGMNSKVALLLWKGKEKLVGSPDGLKEKAKAMGSKLKKIKKDVGEMAKAPRVKELFKELADFIKQLRTKGAERLDELMERWPQIKQKLDEVLKQLVEFGREMIADKLRNLAEEIESMLEHLRQDREEPAQKPSDPVA